MQKVEIMTATKAQLPAIFQMAATSFTDSWSEALWQKTLENPNAAILCAVIEMGASIPTIEKITCGYLALSYGEDAISIDEIAVHPDYRRQGIAKMLLTSAHKQYPTQDFWLEVRQSNYGAIALYQSLGYEPVGLRKRYYQNPVEHAVLMTRFARPITS